LIPFSIVFICTGNRFRSPLAEAFVRRLTSDLHVLVRSVGILDLGRVPALPEAVKLAHRRGIDLSAHRSEYVGARSLADVDLVLGFEEPHVHLAVVDAGAPREQSFTVRELVQLLAEVADTTGLEPTAGPRESVRRAADLRGAAHTVLADISMPDPFGHSWDVYVDTEEEIHSLAVSLVASLFGVSATPAGGHAASSSEGRGAQARRRYAREKPPPRRRLRPRGVALRRKEASMSLSGITKALKRILTLGSAK
jgi:protein-tyrosine phosphatase